MNHPKANRLRLAVAVAVVAAFAAFVPSAGAAISSTVSGKFQDATPGAASSYSNLQTFDYSANTLPYTDNEDLKKWLIDAPAGQIGNPNAIPKATRCTEAQFTTVIDPGSDNVPPYFNACPPGSKVGIAGLVLARDDTGAEIDANGGSVPTFGAFTVAGLGSEYAYTDSLWPGDLTNATPGTIFLLDNGDDPEIPVILGTFFHLSSVPGVGPAGAAVTRSSLAPVTSGPDGDFRIRVIPEEDTPHRTVPTGFPPPNDQLPLHIKRIMQHLNGMVDPDVVPSMSNPTGLAQTGDTRFLSNPTRCDAWTTYSYAKEYGTNSSANSDPTPPGEGTIYTKSPGDDTQPTGCQGAATPFPVTVDASVNLGARDSNPSLTVTVNNPVNPGGDLPKDMKVTLPPTITTDLQKILPENICSIENRDAGTCQPGAKVGTVKVETPFLVGGLAGDVYITKSDNSSLPNLAIYVKGAIEFRLDVNNKFVGPRGNQIESTLTNLPQALFTKFTLVIDGGNDTLLTIPPCKTDGSSPEDGPITASVTSWAGASASSSNPTNFNGCYGKPKVSKLNKCVKSKLSVTPRNLINRAGIAKVELYVGSTKRKLKRIKTDKASPFKFSVKLSSKKYKKGRKFYYRVRTVYKPTVDVPGGKVEVSNTSTFKRCK